MKLGMSNRKEWPDTEPPDGRTGGYCINGTPYMKSEVSPGKWQWVVDEKSKQASANMENHRRALWHALSTRVLTYDELGEVGWYGRWLNIADNVPYNAQEKLIELQNALLIQQMLRGREILALTSPK